MFCFLDDKQNGLRILSTGKLKNYFNSNTRVVKSCELDCTICYDLSFPLILIQDCWREKSFHLKANKGEVLQIVSEASEFDVLFIRDGNEVDKSPVIVDKKYSKLISPFNFISKADIAQIILENVRGKDLRLFIDSVNPG